MRSTSSHRQRGFVAGRTKQFGVFSPITLGVGWDSLDRCQLPCDSQPCCPRHSLTHLRAGPQTPKYSLVVALGLSKQNSRWGRWQGSQGHISILPHLSVTLDLDIQKLPPHWGVPVPSFDSFYFLTLWAEYLPWLIMFPGLTIKLLCWRYQFILKQTFPAEEVSFCLK